MMYYVVLDTSDQHKSLKYRINKHWGYGELSQKKKGQTSYIHRDFATQKGMSTHPPAILQHEDEKKELAESIKTKRHTTGILK